jgi:general secretion pathway protein C
MLDLFFKKYAWTANLVLIFAAAWLCARTVNTVIGATIRPRPVVDLTTLPPPPPRQEPPRLETDRLYALIGQKAPAVAHDDAAEQARTPQNCRSQGATPVRSGLRAQLVAAIVADRSLTSIASIIDLNTRETRIYGIGDPVLGAPVLSIERLRDETDATGAGFKIVAVICNNGTKEFIDFEPGDGSPAPPTSPAARVMPAMAESAPAGPGPDGVQKVTDNRYEVKKKYIDDTLSNLSRIATQARIVPSFKNGVANGFKLFSIQPGSLYTAIGVENGDVIQKINGYEINSPDKALEVYQKLRESPHITIEIERNGQIIRKEYNVTGT